MTQPSNQPPFELRQQRLRAALEERKLPLLVVSRPANIFYLTGFRGSAGVAVFGASKALLWVDPRYTLQARGEAQGVGVIETRTGLFKAVGRWLRKKRARRVGYEDSSLSCADFALLRHEFDSRGGSALRCVPASGCVEKLRAVKEPGEVELIRRAGRLTAEVWEEVLADVRPGLREADLAAEIEYRMKRKGADGPAFETIVASGPRGAQPHARASGRRLEVGELVIFDLGAILAGYVTDMTRTVYLGRPRRRVQQLYQAVLEAQQGAAEMARAGVRCEEVDAAARRALERRGLARYFTHSTGHGVGLEVHERPRLGRGDKSRLEAGSVVTLEPGIYIEGLGGIRTEDTVLVGTDGPEVLTPAARDCWVIS